MRVFKWHYVYVLLSQKDNDLYVGYTSDLKRRLQEHNAKKNFSTKMRLPMTLIYTEACLSKDDAQRREYYLKTTQGRRMLKLRLKDYFHSSMVEKLLKTPLQG